MAEVRLRDVAREAGVHTATASRALNPRTRDRVHPRTAAKVDEAAARLGYAVNLAARTLRTQRSQMVGVLIPDISRPLYPPLMRGIVDALEREGYSALLAATDEDEQQERRLVASLRARGVDGFILATAHVRHALLEAAGTLGVPTVTVNRTATAAPVTSVAPDNEAGMAYVAAHLVALGHRRIAHIAGPADTSTGQARSVGLHQALERLGMGIDPALGVSTETYSIAEGVRATRRLLVGGEPFTAIVTGNDLLALGAMDVLRESRIDCPGQISVTGFNDLPMMDRVTPALTTVRVPQYEMGRVAAQLLVDQMLGDRRGQDAGDASTVPEVRHEVLPVELVVRDSTGRPPGNPRRTGRRGA